jgi:hypothetical protein
MSALGKRLVMAAKNARKDREADDEVAIKTIANVLQYSGHFNNTADWVVEELAKDVLRALKTA